MNKYYDLNILEAINNDLKIISRLSQDVNFYFIDIISELKKIKKCTEKIKLEMKEEYEVRRDLEREGYYYQELNNESENDFNERDEQDILIKKREQFKKILFELFFFFI